MNQHDQDAEAARESEQATRAIHPNRRSTQENLAQERMQSLSGLSFAATSCMTIDVQDIAIPIDRLDLEGSLAFPMRAAGLVMFAHGMFAHGSGSSRHSPRNRHVAGLLNERGLATLLFDLLTALAALRAPTLLIVGGADAWVLQANREAAARMTAPHEVAVVPDATHLFEEPGALDEVARLAGAWFLDHFAAARAKEAS